MGRGVKVKTLRAVASVARQGLRALVGTGEGNFGEEIEAWMTDEWRQANDPTSTVDLYGTSTTSPPAWEAKAGRMSADS